MMPRFACPTAVLRLGSLLRRSRRALYGSLVLALAAHASFSFLAPARAGQVSVKPLTTQFVKRQPRLTKPLELKKRPRPRKRVLERTMVSVRARVDHRTVGSTIQAGRIARSLARPSIRVARASLLDRRGLEPVAVAKAIEGAEEDQSKVDMSLEMMDVEALDTGKYRAMVIQDPGDKRSVRGFLHLAVVYWPRRFHSSFQGYIQQVVYAVNKYTAIKTDLSGYYTFDSSEMLKMPWVFVPTNFVGFSLTRSEASNLGRYLTRGGFLFMEAMQAHAWERPAGGLEYRYELVSGQGMLKDAFATTGYRYGKEWTFEKLLGDHPMYHCYFDFGGPLPSFWPDRVLADEFMYGITIDGRLLAVFETGDYERFINDAEGKEGTRYRQFLVNVIVYALTQEGSLTQRLMDLVSY